MKLIIWGNSNCCAVSFFHCEEPEASHWVFSAAYWRPEQEQPLIAEGLKRPDLVYLLAGWGRERDTVVITATEADQRVGATWYRFWCAEQHSYGYLSPEIPELANAFRADDSHPKNSSISGF